jgi:hypothetical protein
LSTCQDYATSKYSQTTGATTLDTCQACPENSQSVAGSPAIASCKCNAGFSGPDGGTCLACEAGSYKATAGSLACTFCEVGFYSTAEAAVSVATCVACPSDSYSVEGSARIDQCYCNPGYRQTPSHDACIQCDPGYYDSITDQYEYSTCAGGLYSAAVAATDVETCKS